MNNKKELIELIESMLDQKLNEYDDLVRAITKEVDTKEKAELIEDLKGISTTITDLINELPEREPEIKIVNGLVQ